MDAVEVFNSLPDARLEDDLLACCAAPAWGSAIIGKRPYADRPALLAAADAASLDLSWADVLAGLAAHPRIGERPVGHTQEAVWSRREQSAAAENSDDTTRSALIEANRAYEERFGHVFLIFASGRTQEEILAAVRARLTHDATTEREIVADQLRQIALLRLERVLDAL